jgi:hypothetical protein
MKDKYILWYLQVFSGIMGKKVKTSVTLDEDLLKWIDGEIKTKRFASRTHALEFAIEQLKNLVEP